MAGGGGGGGGFQFFFKADDRCFLLFVFCLIFLAVATLLFSCFCYAYTEIWTFAEKVLENRIVF